MNSESEPGLLTDIHSHLVPGVDDGARSVENVLEGVGRMVERGVRSIVTTPHLNGSLTLDRAGLDTRLAEVDDAFILAARAVQDRYPDVRFQRGHEVMLDVPDADLRDPRIHLGDTRAVLVEWPRLQIPPETVPALRRLQAQELEVIVAHPERYSGYGETLELMERWRDQGVILQVNYGSLLGRYGSEARARAFRMLERGWADCMATDFHGRRELRLFVEGARRVLVEVGGEEIWQTLSQVNPARILCGERPLPVLPIEEERGFLARIRSLLRH